MLTETILRWVTEYGYIGLFLLLTLGTLPAEALAGFAGFLVYNGQLQLFPTIAAVFLGSVCGVTLSYGFGRTVGNYLIIKFGHVVQITEDKVTQPMFRRGLIVWGSGACCSVITYPECDI
jgi:membrane protein DedA with SNARE-associated domain